VSVGGFSGLFRQWNGIPHLLGGVFAVVRACKFGSGISASQPTKPKRLSLTNHSSS